MDIAINYFAVVVAAVAAFLFGWAWHSPILFEKPWIRLMKYANMEDATHGAAVTPTQGIVLNGLMTLVVSYVLAHFVVIANITDLSGSLQLAFWLWLGFMVPIMFNQVLWEKKSWALFGFNAIYQLVSLAIMAVILGLWH